MFDLIATSSCISLDASSSDCLYASSVGSDLHIAIALLIILVTFAGMDFIRRLFASRS